MRRVPDEVRVGLRQQLWALADELGWATLAWTEKTTYYEAWTRDTKVGGLLGNYLDQRRIRVYIKDTLMKGYGRSRLADPESVLRVLRLACGADETADVTLEYERPHGRLLRDGRVIVWADAKDWKAVLMALHERAFSASPGRPFAAVLLSSSGRFQEEEFRKMAKSAADKLGVERLLWLD